MPENGITKIGQALNGATVVSKTPSVDRQLYRPAASTTEVHDEILTSLASVVSKALTNAGSFVFLAAHYDRNETTAVRYGHLVDATECVEIAMTHLGQLKAAFNHRLRTEDAQHLGGHTGEQDTGESPY